MSPAKATCHSRTIDFFIVSQDLAGSVVEAIVVDDALFSPHRPVRLYIRANPRAMMVRTLKAATTIGATLPHGPMTKPVDTGWDEQQMDKHELYDLFLMKMEDEVAAFMGVEGKQREALGGRCKGARFANHTQINDLRRGRHPRTGHALPPDIAYHR